jgi:hypothetical protein
MHHQDEKCMQNFGQKTEGNRPFERLRHRLEDIKIDFKGTGLNLLSVFHCFDSVTLTEHFIFYHQDARYGNYIPGYPNVLIFCYSSCVADAMGSPRLLRQTLCRCTNLNSASLFSIYVFIDLLFKSYVTCDN